MKHSLIVKLKRNLGAEFHFSYFLENLQKNIDTFGKAENKV